MSSKVLKGSRATLKINGQTVGFGTIVPSLPIITPTAFGRAAAYAVPIVTINNFFLLNGSPLVEGKGIYEVQEKVEDWGSFKRYHYELKKMKKTGLTSAFTRQKTYTLTSLAPAFEMKDRLLTLECIELQKLLFKKD